MSLLDDLRASVIEEAVLHEGLTLKLNQDGVVLKLADRTAMLRYRDLDGRVSELVTITAQYLAFVARRELSPAELSGQPYGGRQGRITMDEWRH